MIFFDAAVVVRFQKGHAFVFVKRILLDVEPRAVDVGSDDSHSLRKSLLGSYFQKNQTLTAVVEVFFVAYRQFISEFVFGKTVFLRNGDRRFHGVALGFGSVQKLFVALGIVENFFHAVLVQTFEKRFFDVGQFVRKFFADRIFVVFCHKLIS